jgi:hypothetical protein
MDGLGLIYLKVEVLVSFLDLFLFRFVNGRVLNFREVSV